MATPPPGTAGDQRVDLLGSVALKWLLGMVVAALAVGAIVTSYLIVERQSALQRVSRYNLTWLLSQATNETLRLMELTSAAAVPGANVDKDDVQLRLDVLGNRMSLLEHGEANEFIKTRPDLVDTVGTLRSVLVAAQPLVDRLPDPGAARQVRALLEPLLPKMNQLAALANTRSGDIVAQDQRDLSRLHWSLAGLLFAIMACAASLVWLIGWMREQLIHQLTQAKNAAEAANAAKTQFLRNMSHELRTPLNGVLLAIELVCDGPLPEEQKEFATIARQSSLMLLDLISTVLDFSRIETGHMKLNEREFELRGLIEEIVDTLDVLARVKHIALTTTIPYDLPARWIGDPVRLRQILVNLIGNAIKFTPEGTVAVSVAAIDAHGARPGLRFEIRDTGIGIPREKLSQIFDQFVQADMTYARRFGGTGLGLTIARELVEMMGGDIGVDSREGEGSTFWFTVRMPVAKDARKEVESAARL